MWRKIVFVCLLLSLLATPLITLAAATPTAVTGETAELLAPQQQEPGRDIGRQDWVDRVPLMIIMIIVVILINVVLLRIFLPREPETQS